MKQLSKQFIYYFILLFILLTGLYLLQLYSFLAFHTIVELFSIVVAYGLFMLSWNSKEFNNNSYFVFIGIAYLFIGSIDLLHTMAYKGMNIFHGYGANLPTQFWIQARYLEALTLLTAPFFLRKKIKESSIFIVYSTIFILIILSSFYRVFPSCFIAEEGLTPFKIISEYIISLILLFSILIFYKFRREFSTRTLRLLITSFIFTIISEIAFTFYISVYGILNFVGHLFKLFSFYLIYRALIRESLKKPYTNLFNKFQTSLTDYRNLVDNIPGISYHCSNDKNWTMQFISDEIENISGYPASDFIHNKNRTFASIIHPDDSMQVNTTAQDCINIKKTYSMEYRIIDSENKVKWVYENGKGVFNDDGELSYLEGIIVDVTEQKETEVAILNSRERLKTLNKIIRHDLANDLIVIKSALRIFRKNANLEMLDEAEKRVNDDLKLIERYGKQETFISNNANLIKLNLNKTITEIAKNHNKIKINVSGSGDVFADDNIYTIFENLINNSILHGNSTAIDIEITNHEDMCEIRFADNGIGILDKIKYKVFNEGFHHGESGHTGMGLYIVKKTIIDYGGVIYVEDNKPNGAVFVINLRNAEKLG